MAFGGDTYAAGRLGREAPANMTAQEHYRYGEGRGIDIGEMIGTGEIAIVDTVMAVRGLYSLAKSGLSLFRGEPVWGENVAARNLIIRESEVRSAQLQQKYGHLARQERLSRIDQLSEQNYMRRLTEIIDKQEYVFRYLSEDGLNKSLITGNVKGYTTTLFSHSSEEVSRGAQILSEWGVPQYGVAIPTNKLTGFQLARPFGNQGGVGWEVFTNSYPKAGSGGWTQFLTNPVSVDEVYIYIPLANDNAKLAAIN